MPDHAPADTLSVCPRYSLIRSTALLAMGLLLVAGSLAAQPLTVYDDALQNGFQDYSYPSNASGANFASTTVVHSAPNAIAFTGNNYNAVAMAHPGGTFSTAQYPVIHFWINGGAASGQQLNIQVYNGAAVPVNVPLDSFISGGGIAANAWREVTVTLTQAPISYNGSYDRIDLQAETAGTLPTLYIDDVTLTQSAPLGAVASLQIAPATVAGMASDNFTWQDSLGNPRVATLTRNIAPGSPAGPGGSRGGALRQYSYKLTDGTTRTATVTTYPDGGYGGFGYIVSHSKNRPCVTGDDSPLGFVFGGTWQLLFQGRHHAIYRFTQLYPRNCDGTNNPVQRFMPVTIDWVFSTGHDNPLWAVTFDVDQIAAPGQPPVPADTYFDDSRAPYGELNIDGDGGTNLNGVAWGDRYRFTTTDVAGTDVTLSSPFDWKTSNTVPYVQEWLDGSAGKPDATIGIVQTQTITQQDAGGSRDLSIGRDITPYWHKTQADGVHSAGANSLPDGDNWPYQAMGNNLSALAGSNNARMTWKTQYGFIGQTAYTINGGAVESSAATAPGYPKKSYSTYIVLGQRTTAPVEAQVAQVETIQTLTLSAITGSVVTSGPAGITRADNVTYSPAGYNHVYGALAFNASGNALDANISVGPAALVPLKKPLFIIGNYTAGVAPATVRFGGVALTADADYFASVRASANELWLTLNRDLTGATNHLEIIAGASSAPSALVATAATISHIDLTWTAAAGGGPYDVYRKDSAADWGLPIATNVAATTFGQDGLTADHTYVYRVAVHGSSSYSNVDAATTTMFTDDPLSAGTAIKLAHITQLRTAVNAMRAVNNLGNYAFTDSTLTTATPIRAAHINDLRTALTAARSSIGLTTLVYTDDPVAAGSTAVKAQHIIELRNGVK